MATIMYACTGIILANCQNCCTPTLSVASRTIILPTDLFFFRRKPDCSSPPPRSRKFMCTGSGFAKPTKKFRKGGGAARRSDKSGSTNRKGIETSKLAGNFSNLFWLVTWPNAPCWLRLQCYELWQESPRLIRERNPQTHELPGKSRGNSKGKTPASRTTEKIQNMLHRNPKPC